MVAVKNRHNAMLNPHAHVKKEVTVEEVLNSKPLAWPIKLLDVPPISDGAAAIVLSCEDKAAQSTDRPAWIRGMVISARPTTLPPARCSSPSRWRSPRGASIAPPASPIRAGSSIVVEVQEPYTCFELSYYESLGLCAPGEAAELIKSGATAMDGDIPVNPSGGCAGANPIGAAGLIRIIEAASQVMGKAGAMQIPGAKLALAQSGGGWANLRGVAVCSRPNPPRKGEQNMLATPDTFPIDMAPFKSDLSMPYTLTPGRATGAFLAEIKSHKIVGSKFKSGSVVVPAQDFCPSTGDSDFDLVEAPDTGVLTAFTETAEGLIGLIRIDGSDFDFPHRMVGASLADLKIGFARSGGLGENPQRGHRRHPEH